QPHPAHGDDVSRATMLQTIDLPQITGSTMPWEVWFAGLQVACSAGDLTEDARLLRAKAFIDAHYQHPLNLDRVARCALMSRYHFLRSFRRAFGQTPHQYLTTQRLGQARKLLRETDRSITSICFEVGFQSLGSFSSLFHRHIGHPPSRYRAHYVALPWRQPDPPCIVPWCFMRAIRA
ncbi:MAG: AraC family transcriptional regulator, partial [Myxococcota bacterium]